MDKVTSKAPNKRHAGFSLIEVLIAILVLATGLLALAALQTRVVRESADARARSQIASFAQTLIEERRAAGYDGLSVGTSVDLATDAELAALAVRAGVSNLAESTVVAHYVGSGATFTRHTSLQTVSSKAPQYKQIELELSWTDASGGSRSVGMVTAVSPLSLSSSGLLVTQPLAGFTTSRPIVRRETPEGAGIIPIALADGSETAATNPRPKLGGRHGDTVVSDTRYEVLTYSEFTEGGVQLARIQERVETAVLGCQCRNDTDGFDSDLATLLTTTAFRPTFWTGTRYSDPVPASYAVTTSQEPNGSGNNAFVQSELCDICCRDHQDPDGVADAKFDPMRGGAHQHCASIGIVDGEAVCVEPGEGENYLEACRAIRVDGVFRIASDARMEHMSLIPTDSNATDPGIGGAQDAYETFVLNFMTSRFPEGTTPTNTAVADATAETLAAGAGLNVPAFLTLNPNASPDDLRWLHSRGLYIDYLEPDAIEEIDDAWDDCELEGSERIKCILPFVPFSAVNLTDIAEWSEQPENTGELLWLDVSNASATVFGDPEDPVRGRSSINPTVTLPATGTIPDNLAVPAARLSNSTLARFDAVDPHDDSLSKTDTQEFRVQTGTPPPPASGAQFEVVLTHPSVLDASADNDPRVTLVVTETIPECDGPVDSTYTCTSETTSDVEVTVASYNFLTPAANNGDKVDDPCDISAPIGRIRNQYCNVYPVSSVDHNGTALTPDSTANPGTLDEQTIFTLGTVTTGDTVSVVFGTPTVAAGTPTCPSGTVVWTCP